MTLRPRRAACALTARRFAYLWFVALAGCLPDGLTEYDFDTLRPPRPEPEADRVFERVGEAEAGTLRVVLYAEGGPHVGYTRLRVGVTDRAGAPVRQARVSVAAEVARGAGWAAAPVEGPETTTADAEGYFSAAAFLFPEAAGRPARLRVGVEADGHAAASATFEVAVAADPLGVRVVAADGAVYHAAWVQPQRAVVGENAFEARLFQEAPGGFAPLGGAEVQLYPYMDMGGGEGHSTPFEPPFETEAGRWRSRINFIMAGGWELSLYVRRAGLARDTVRFAPFVVHER
jgi:hypothetical protein